MYFNTKLISYLLYPPISFIFPVGRVTAKKWQKLGSLSASCVVVNKRQTNPKKTLEHLSRYVASITPKNRSGMWSNSYPGMPYSKHTCVPSRSQFTKDGILWGAIFCFLRFLTLDLPDALCCPLNRAP